MHIDMFLYDKGSKPRGFTIWLSSWSSSSLPVWNCCLIDWQLGGFKSYRDLEIRELYTRSINWPVLSDEHSWAVWMAIFPAKWRANEQRLVGLEHLRVRIHCKDLCMEQQKLWITAHDSLSFVLYVRLWLCDFKYMFYGHPETWGRWDPFWLVWTIWKKLTNSLFGSVYGG